MWGRELRAGLAFVLVSLLAGAGVRAWRRDHEVRFQEVVETLVEQDQALAERTVGPRVSGATAEGPSRRQNSPREVPLRPAALDVDRASVPEWIRLPGIGPSLAARIVADREARGPFAAPDGLLRVPGIGPKILEKIRPFLATGQSAAAASDSSRPIALPAKPLR